ncbi:winged helix-turn-helix transcriptional regulator [Methanolobus sp. ZRKC2]|uniref:winged helix-turn-helix transcriptional regulator n=1 Tax=Methanolobus sp. ZRKC2 TaxID=3125783 RepID=UPI00324545E6
MTLKSYAILRAVCVLFLVSITCFTSSAEYIIETTKNASIPDEYVCSSGAEGTLTFWELPLYFKLISIGCFLSFSLFGPLKFLPILLGKSKFVKRNKNRQNILSYISDHPGCSETDILNDLDMKRGTFRYHVEKLGLANMLVFAKKGKFTSYFRNELLMDDKTISSSTHMRKDTRKKVFEAILKEPGITNKELSSKLGLDKSTINWHINKLEEEDVINYEKHGRFKRYYPKVGPKMNSDKKTPGFSK